MFEFVLIITVAAVPAIVLHEFAHGWVAHRLGDQTALLQGRLTLNPVKHIDLVGTILVPGALYLVHFFGWTSALFIFGWAKPVPVNFSRLNNPKRDVIWVGLAGPAVNIVLAFVLAQCTVFFHLSLLGYTILAWAVKLNICLALFNMIPIPPLDGSRVVSGLIPASWEKSYLSLEPYGFLILIVLLNTGAMRFLEPMISNTAMWMGLK